MTDKNGEYGYLVQIDKAAEGGALCGAAPFSTGGSFATAEQAGAKECGRCRQIINKALEN